MNDITHKMHQIRHKVLKKEIDWERDLKEKKNKMDREKGQGREKFSEREA